MEHNEPSMKHHDNRMRMLLDGVAERRCRERAAEYFGDTLRRIRVIDNSTSPIWPKTALMPAC